MNKKTSRATTLRQYITEVLKNAVYEKGEALDVIVAEAPDLSGCVTQGRTVEQARENLIDAIEVWVMAGLRCGEDPPSVNGCRLAITISPGGRRRGKTQSNNPSRVGA
jgi:predicted RNase H-like HicB family nuclease